MKQPLFAPLGDDYPSALESRYERILNRIVELWDSPKINEYFSDLLIDKRGGRQGFPQDVLKDILKLRDFHELENLRRAETPADAEAQLLSLGHLLNEEDFYKALQAGNKEVVDLYVRANFNIRMVDSEGNTPLLFALKRGYTVIADILLKAGSDVNAMDKLRLTPLLIASGKPSQGYRNITEALIRKGAYLDVRDRLGNSPFLLAVSGGMLDIATMLAERGADIHATNRRGESVASLIAAMEDPAQREPFENLILETERARAAKPQTSASHTPAQ